MAKECTKSVTNVQSCRFKTFLSPIPLGLVGVPNTLMKTKKVSVGLPIGVKQPKISRSVAVKFNLSHSSERILILVFLWNKATNFRGIVGDCLLAAPTDFIRGISAGKLDSSRLDASSETQGQLVGSIKCSWWKFSVTSRRAPGHLLLPNQFQKRLNCLLLIGQKKLFLTYQRREAAGWLSCFLTRRNFPHRSP